MTRGRKKNVLMRGHQAYLQLLDCLSIPQQVRSLHFAQLTALPHVGNDPVQRDIARVNHTASLHSGSL